MEIKSTINIILKDLAEARDLIDDLKNYPGVPLLQVELAKAKCRSAEDVIQVLAELSDDLFVSKEVKVTTVLPVEEPVEDNPKIESPVITEDSEIHRQKITKAVDEIINLKEREPEEPKKEKEKKIVADKFAHLSNRINEQIGDQKKDDQNSGKISKPLTDLTREIGINDRFFFIREVFGGRQEKYTSVISDLNNADSMDEAVRIIKESTGSEPEDEPVRMLLDLVKRKISSAHHE